MTYEIEQTTRLWFKVTVRIDGEQYTYPAIRAWGLDGARSEALSLARYECPNAKTIELVSAREW